MFKEMPRYVGIPQQVYCESEFAFKKFEADMKNKVPFFTTTNQFVDRTTPIVDNMFFDIDSYGGLRTPYRDVKLLKDWCERKGLQTIINFSGGKGFHVYVFFKPIIPKTDAQKDRLKLIIYSLQKRMVDDIGIEEIDDPTLGRLHFLCRYPTSLYLRKGDTGKLEESGFYCRHLTHEEFDLGLKHITKLAREPGIVPNGIKSDKTLADIVHLFNDFKIVERIGQLSQAILSNRTGVDTPTINALGASCLKEIVTHSHPPHFERIEVVSFLKWMGYTDEAIASFIQQRNWTRYNSSTTNYQITTIKARFPKCSYLRTIYGSLCEKCSWGRCH